MFGSVDSFAALHAFVQAADKRSFKLAGQQLGLTASAVGKAVQRLEEQLSVRLFHRSTRSIALTAEGALFLDRCRHILAELEAAQAELAQSGAAPRGRLKVSLPVASSLLLPAIDAFAQVYPEIELDLDFNDRFVDVIEEGFDVVIRSGEPKDSRLMHRKIGSFSWNFVASPSYLKQHGMPRTVHDLHQHVCLRHRFPETGRIMSWPIESIDVTVPVSITMNMMDALVFMAESGRGIACLPYFAVRRQLMSGRLTQIPFLENRSIGTLSLLWPSSRFPLPKVRAFVDFVAEKLVPEFADDKSVP